MIDLIRSYLPLLVAVCVLPIIGGAILMGLAGRRYRLYGGRINGVFGEVGTGKSMFVVAKVLRPVAKSLHKRGHLRCVHTGRKVTRIFTNFEFKPEVFGYTRATVIRISPHPTLSFWEQLLTYTYRDELGDVRLDAVIALDEAHLFHPSDDLQFDGVAKAALTNIRKMNAEFWFMATDHMLVHKRLRKFARRLWMMRECEGGFASASGFRWFAADGCKRDDNGNPIRPNVDRRIFRMSRKVTRSYNSFEAIAADWQSMQLFEDTVNRMKTVAAGDSVPDSLAELPADATTAL